MSLVRGAARRRMTVCLRRASGRYLWSVNMIKVLLWAVGIIFIIGLLAVIGVLDFIF